MYNELITYPCDVYIIIVLLATFYFFPLVAITDTESPKKGGSRVLNALKNIRFGARKKANGETKKE